MLVKSTVIVVFSFAFLFKNIFSRPSIDAGSDPLSVCYSLNCPEGTTICGKHSEVSTDDKSMLNVQIRCYDEEGNILRSKNATEENPFGPDVYYKGTKLSAVIRLVPAYFYNPDDDEDDDKEPSYAVPVNYPKAKTGPKSEVEDLNAR